MSFWTMLFFYWPPLAVYLGCLFLLHFLPRSNDKKIYINDCARPFEIFILLKTTRFKNNQSGTWYFIKAVGRTALFVLATLSIFFIYIIKFKSLTELDFEVDPITVSGSLLIVMIAFYWNERTSYVSKWEYLANLYNKMIEANSIEQYEMYRTSLVHDIHLTEFWGHKTFWGIFHKAIAEAKGFKNGEDFNLTLSDSEVEELLDKFHEERLGEFKNSLKRHARI